LTTNEAANVVFKGDNPFGVDPDFYARLPNPPADSPTWSATYYWSAWNPEAGVGVYIHMGVEVEDKHLSWAQVFAYLPNEMVVADRSWGRSPDRRGPTTGNFSAVCSEPLKRWSLKFDGAGELVSCAEMATRLVGPGFAVPMAFEVDWTATMPVWDLFKAVDIGSSDIGHVHHEQVGVSRGWLRVGDREFGGEWSLDGMAFRDHSQGPRDVRPFGGDHLLGVYFPKSNRSLQILMFWNKAGEFQFRVASLHQGDEIEIIPDVEMTGVERGVKKPTSLHDLLGNPKTFKIKLGTRQGPVILEGQIVHTCNISVMGANTNVNGSAINIAGDHLVLAECQTRLTWPDGDVGYGFFERTYAKSLLASATR
jgi:hypothetical protein